MKELHFPEIIKGSRITLKKHQVSLAADIFACVEHDRERLARFLPWVPKTLHVQDEINYIKLTHDLWDQHKMYDFGIFENSTGAFIGNVGVHNIIWVCDRCELGYWIFSKFEGKGFVREAVQLLTKKAFSLGFNRVEIFCAPDNARSAAVPKALGFTYEARLAEHMKDAFGNYRDSLVFAHLKSQGDFELPEA